MTDPPWPERGRRLTGLPAARAIVGGATREEALAGLRNIRLTAEAFMNKRDLADDGWTETEVTAVAVTEGRPHIQVVMFNQNQEGRGPNAVGADYLWWWVDSRTGECFGMLVQAKRLLLVKGRWSVNIGHRDGEQLRTLLRTATELQVPAVYSVYTGGLVYRAGMPCLHAGRGGTTEAAPAAPGTTPGTGQPQGEECQRCRSMAISIVTAYQLSSTWELPRNTGDMVCTESIPLEDLLDPAVPALPIHDLNIETLTNPNLLEFLVHPQLGARETARRIFRLVATQRSGQFSAATAEPTFIPGAPVFRDVPKDTGHYPGPYFRHILQGLRATPPTYVSKIIDDLSNSPWPNGTRDTPSDENRPTSAWWRPRPAELARTGTAGIVLVTI